MLNKITHQCDIFCSWWVYCNASNNQNAEIKAILIYCSLAQKILSGTGTEAASNAQNKDHPPITAIKSAKYATPGVFTHLWRDNDVYVLEQNRYFDAHQKLPTSPQNESAFEQFMGPQYAPAITHEQAESFIKANKAKPFFLYYASTLPHMALQAPKEWVDRYPREWDQQPYLGQNGYLPNLRPRATYAAMISYLDDCVGKLTKLVDDLGLSGDTVFLFKADNGTAPNGGLDRAFFSSLGGLRGIKTNLYEGGIRVPFIARWKGHFPAGATESRAWASYDVRPTLAELAGAPVSGGLDGLSFAPALQGLPQAKAHDFLYFEYPEGPQQQAVIAGGMKLIRPNLKSAPGKAELYDLESDPEEKNDLAASRKGDLERLLAIAKREHRPSKDFPIPTLDGKPKSRG